MAMAIAFSVGFVCAVVNMLAVNIMATRLAERAVLKHLTDSGLVRQDAAELSQMPLADKDPFPRVGSDVGAAQMLTRANQCGPYL